MEDINPIVWIILVISSLAAVAPLAIVALDRWCKRQNRFSPFHYWCNRCRIGTIHINKVCQGCAQHD